MKNLKKFVLEHINNLIEGDEDAGDYDREMDMDFDPGAQADAVHDQWKDDMALHPSEHPDASAEAHKRGLTYDGWGFWKDNTGKRVAKTQDGKLYSLPSPEEQRKQYGDPVHGPFGRGVLSNDPTDEKNRMIANAAKSKPQQSSSAPAKQSQQPAGGLGPNGQHISPMPNKYPDTDQAAPGGGKSFPPKQQQNVNKPEQQTQPQHPESREQQIAQRERLLNVYMTAYDKWLAAVKDLENQGDRNAVNTADYSGVENARKAIEDFDAKNKEVIKALRAAELEKKADLDAYERAHEKGLKTT